MIPLHDYLAFLSIVTLIVVSPGANLFLLLQATPVQGRVTGVLMTLGFCVAIISHATLALISGVVFILIGGRLLISRSTA